MSKGFPNVRKIGDRVSVPIPHDENGFLGRECPVGSCLGYFKVKPGTGLSGPDLSCHCPYCGKEGDPNSFWTPEQIEYAKSVVVRQFAGAIREDLKAWEFDHPPQGPFGIGIRMTLKPGTLPAVKQYCEKDLETDVVCERCTLHYAVFGLFAYCPDCGIHNSLQVLQRNIALVGKQLALAESLESSDLRRHLIEDALENCVSAFDGFARETCRVRAHQSTNPERCRTLSFQNLDRANEALSALFGVDLSTSVDPLVWQKTERAFFKRHLLAHCSGVIDEKYKRTSGDPTAIVGRSVAIDPAEVTDVAITLLSLGEALVQLLPKPQSGDP